MIKNAQEYYATVERWTAPSNRPTTRFGRRDGMPYYIQNPTGRTPEELTEMIEQLRERIGLGPTD